MTEKQRRRHNMKVWAAEASYFRLKGQIQTASEFEAAMEQIYREARANGWGEDTFILAEEQGRKKGSRKYDKESLAAARAARRKLMPLARLRGE